MLISELNFDLLYFHSQLFQSDISSINLSSNHPGLYNFLFVAALSDRIVFPL